MRTLAAARSHASETAEPETGIWNVRFWQEFPPSQKVGSFGIDQVLEKLQVAPSGSNSHRACGCRPRQSDDWRGPSPQYGSTHVSEPLLDLVPDPANR